MRSPSDRLPLPSTLVTSAVTSGAPSTGHDRRGLVLGCLVLPALPDQLLDRGQRVSVFLLCAPWWRDRPALHVLWPAGFLACPAPAVGCVTALAAHPGS